MLLQALLVPLFAAVGALAITPTPSPLDNTTEVVLHNAYNVSRSSSTVRAGDDMRFRLVPVFVDNGGLATEARVNTSLSSFWIEVHALQYDGGSAIANCSHYHNLATPLSSLTEYGLPLGANLSEVYTSSLYFTITAPSVPFVVCVRPNPEEFIPHSKDVWLMLDNNRTTLDNSTLLISADWWYVPTAEMARYYVRGALHTRSFTPLTLHVTGNTSVDVLYLTSALCDKANSEDCAVGDALKIVPSGRPCEADVQATLFAGTNVVNSTGDWTAEGLTRYAEHATPGGLARFEEGSAALGSTRAARLAASQTMNAFVQLPEAAGNYDVCFSGRALRQGAYNETLAGTDLDALPLWTKLAACDSEVCTSAVPGTMFVTDEPMQWVMRDLTPMTWGVIQFAGTNLSRIASSASHTLAPVGDAFRIAANVDFGGEPLMQVGCFGSRPIDALSSTFDGSAKLTGDPFNTSDTATYSSTTFSTAYVPDVPENGTYHVCYRRWDGLGQWRVLSFDASSMHPVLGGLVYTRVDIEPGQYFDAGTYSWEVPTANPSVEAELDVVVQAMDNVSFIDTHPWGELNSSAASLRVVPYSAACDGAFVETLATVARAVEVRNGGEEDCNFTQIRATLATNAPRTCVGSASDTTNATRAAFHVFMPKILDGLNEEDFRVCMRKGYGNWRSLSHVRAFDHNSSIESMPIVPPSNVSATPLVLARKSAITIAAYEEWGGIDSTFVYSDTVSTPFTTSDEFHFMPTYEDVDIGDHILVVGEPVEPVEGWSPIGKVGRLWQITPVGYRLSFDEDLGLGGIRNAYFLPPSLQRTRRSCQVTRSTFVDERVDGRPQVYCPFSTSDSLHPLLNSFACSSQSWVRSICNDATASACGTTSDFQSFASVTRGLMRGIVPSDADAATSLAGLAAVMRVPPASFVTYSVCYRAAGAGWLRLDKTSSGRDVGEEFLSLEADLKVSPAPAVVLVGSMYQNFSVSSSIQYVRVVAKFVAARPDLANDNCVLPPAGTATNNTASAVNVGTSGWFQILSPEVSGEYHLCLQLLETLSATSASWFKLGPYTVQHTGITWAADSEIVNHGAVVVRLKRDGVLDTRPNGDYAKIVAKDDTCHSGEYDLGPLGYRSVSVSKLVTDLGPSDEPSPDATFYITLPASENDAPLIYHVCVRTFFSATGTHEWVEVSHADGLLFVSSPSGVEDWVLDDALIPHFNLGLDGKMVGMAGASTRVASAVPTFVVRFHTPPADDVAINFKLVRVGAPRVRVPVDANGAGWDWDMDEKAVEAGCEGPAAYGTTPTDLCNTTTGVCVGGAFVDSGRQNYSMDMTLPDVGVYIVCLKMGSASWVIAEPNTNGSYLYTLPTYLEYEKDDALALNLTVHDVRWGWSDGVLRPLGGWCGASCGDYIRITPWRELCLPPPDSGDPAQSGFHPIASYDGLTASLQRDSDQQVTRFAFPPYELEGEVLKVCIYRNASHASSNSTLPFITKAGVVYTAWNRGALSNGGGTPYWRSSAAINRLLLSSSADLSSPVRLLPGSILEVKVRPAVDDLPVATYGQIVMVTCPSEDCLVPPGGLTQQDFLSNVIGCRGDDAKLFQWETFGARQHLDTKGEALYQLSVQDACPNNRCLFRFFLRTTTSNVWSDIIEVVTEFYAPDALYINGEQGRSCVWEGPRYICHHDLACIENVNCPVVVTARYNESRLYTAIGAVDMTHTLPLPDYISRLGFQQLATVEFVRGEVEFKSELRGALDKVLSGSLNITLAAGNATARLNVTYYKQTAETLLANSVDIMPSVKEDRRKRGLPPLPPWTPVRPLDRHAQTPSVQLSAATGSYLMVDTPYELVYSARNALGGRVNSAAGWFVKVNITAHPLTYLTTPSGVPIEDYMRPEAVAVGVWRIPFVVKGGVGCSRVNENPYLPGSFGFGCRLNLHVWDTVTDRHFESYIFTPVRVPATTLKIVPPGGTLFDVDQPTSAVPTAEVPLRLGLEITAVPGSAVGEVFVNDEFHYGSAFALPDEEKFTDGVTVTGQSDGNPTLHPFGVVSQTSGASTRSVWAASWVLSVSGPCLLCEFSFHSQEGASPGGFDGVLETSFTDDTAGLSCGIDNGRVSWFANSPTSTAFNITISPITARNQNTMWPRWAIQIDRLRTSQHSHPITLHTTHDAVNGTDISGSLRPLADGNAQVHFPLYFTSEAVPGVLTSFEIHFRVAPQAGEFFTGDYTCQINAAIIPRTVDGSVSMRVARVHGAQALCSECNEVDPCDCDNWSVETSKAERVDLEFHFWEDHAITEMLSTQMFTVSPRIDGLLPFWLCTGVDKTGMCRTSHEAHLSTPYTKLKGVDENGDVDEYTYGTFGAVTFEKNNSNTTQGVAHLIMLNQEPRPGRKMALEVCRIIHGADTDSVGDEPLCRTIYLWVRAPVETTTYEVGILDWRATDYYTGAPINGRELSAGGLIDGRVCGAPTRITVRAVVYYELDNVRYAEYARALRLSVQHGAVPAALLAEGSSEVANMVAVTHPADQQVLSSTALQLLDFTGELTVDFYVFNPASAGTFRLNATSLYDHVTLSVLPTETSFMYSVQYPSGLKHNALVVRDAVTDAVECPGRDSKMMCATANYLASCINPGEGWSYTNFVRSGYPFPVNIAIDSTGNNGRTWAYPRSTLKIDHIPSTTGCGDGGQFAIWTKRSSVAVIESPDSFEIATSAELVSGAGVVWMTFSEACQHCVVRFQLCDPSDNPDVCVMSAHPGAPPLPERTRYTKTFAVNRVDGTESIVVVKSQDLPPVESTVPSLGGPAGVIRVGSVFKVQLKPVLQMGGKWTYNMQQDAPITARLYSKWIESPTVQPASARYGNGGFIVGVTSSLTDCTVNPNEFDIASTAGIAFTPEGGALFQFSHTCSLCELWVGYDGASGEFVSFPLKVLGADGAPTAQNLLYQVRTCGVQWILLSAQGRLEKRKPFALTAWRVDQNNQPSWTSAEGDEVIFGTRGVGVGGNGGGVWDVITHLTENNGVIPSDGVAVVKLMASRTCYDCSIRFAGWAHNFTVVAPPTQLVVIPHPDTELVQECCNYTSRFRFTVYAADEYGDRSFLPGGPTPLAWLENDQVTIKPSSLSLNTTAAMSPITWRNDVQREQFTYSIDGSCFVNGVPQGHLCGEKADAGEVVIELAGGPLTDLPLEFQLSGFEGVTRTVLLGSDGPPRISRGIPATEITVDNRNIISLTPDVPTTVLVYGVGRVWVPTDATQKDFDAFMAEGAVEPGPQLAHRGVLGINNASIVYNCAACTGCMIDDETVQFVNGIAEFHVVLRGNMSSPRGSCSGDITTDNPNIASQRVVFEVDLIPRFTWVYTSSDTIHVADPPATPQKTSTTIAEKSVALQIKCYTRFFERTEVGGYVAWETRARSALLDTLQLVMEPAGCFVPTSVVLNVYGTVITMHGSFGALPCNIVDLYGLPASTAIYNSLLVTETVPTGVEVVLQTMGGNQPPQVYTGLTGTTHSDHAAAITQQLVQLHVRTTYLSSAVPVLATGDFFTEIFLHGRRLSDEFTVSATAAGGFATLEFALPWPTNHEDPMTHVPWDLELRTDDGNITVPQALPGLYAVALATQIVVEYRSLPVFDPADADFREAPWTPVVDNVFDWMTGASVQLRLTTVTAGDAPNVVAYSGSATFHPYSIPCPNVDTNLTWLAGTCLPPLVGDSSWTRGKRRCTDDTLVPCETEGWILCSDALRANGGELVELLTPGGIVQGRVEQVVDDLATVLVDSGPGGDERVLEVPVGYLHRSGCLTDGEASPTTAVKFNKGIGYIDSLYTLSEAGERYFRFVLDGPGTTERAQKLLIRLQEPTMLAMKGDSCVDYTTDANGTTICGAPFGNATVETRTAFDLSVVVEDVNRAAVRSDMYTIFAISAECITTGVTFRLGVLGGVSGQQVTVLQGWNTSAVVGGIARFERLAFYGECDAAVLKFECTGVSPDVAGACQRLRMVTEPFRVVPMGSVQTEAPTGELPSTPAPAPPVYPAASTVLHPTLVIDLLNFDDYTFGDADKDRLEATLFESIQMYSEYPHDVKRVALYHLCSIMNLRVAQGITDDDRMNPYACRRFDVPDQYLAAGVPSGMRPPTPVPPIEFNETTETVATETVTGNVTGTLGENATEATTAPASGVQRGAGTLGRAVVEDCRSVGCTTLAELIVVVLNPSDAAVARDVQQAFTAAVQNPNSPLRTRYILDPKSALVSYIQPPQPTAVPATTAPAAQTSVPRAGPRPPGGATAEPGSILRPSLQLCTILGAISLLLWV